MLRRFLLAIGIAVIVTGCGTTRVWRGADPSDAAVLKYSSDFKIDTIDGSFLSKPDFSVNMGTSKIFFSPGFHSVQCHYDNGAVYTTGYPISVSHNFEARKIYRIVVYDRDKDTDRIRLAIREETDD